MDCPDIPQIRLHLLECFKAGFHAVQGRTSVSDALKGGLNGQWHLIAIGKASASMAQGAVDVLGDQLLSGLVISKTGHFENSELDGRFQCLEAEHPVPGEGTLAAGEALLGYCSQIPEGAQVLCCISGGASSLVEALPEGMSLEKLQQVNQYLLGIGLDIGAMNTVRQSLSRIKAGRLADLLKGRIVKALYISDVPGDDIPTIGSGPLAAPLGEGLSEINGGLGEILGDVDCVPPASGEESHVEHTIVASLDLAKAAAEACAKSLGYPVHVHPEFLEGEAATAAVDIASTLKASEPGVHIWGGETVVMLPDEPGRGGRNQHFALAAADCLAGDDTVVLLVAGTDGSDGPTQDAGGLVDGGTLGRGELAGLDVADHLRNADAGTYLEACGDLVNTGPTGTNVMDLVIGVKC